MGYGLWAVARLKRNSTSDVILRSPATKDLLRQRTDDSSCA